MSNIDATRVMDASIPGMGGGSATVQMPALGDPFRTQMGGTTTCPVCKSTTPLLDAYCGDCGYLLTSEPAEELALPPEEAPAAELVDEQTGRRYRLRVGVNTVGRQGTDILATEGTVSRNHATITVSASGIVVEDLGSSNGTKVGDLRLQPNSPVAAQVGVTLRFGSWKLALVGGASPVADQTIVVALADKTVALTEDQALIGKDEAEPPPAAAAPAQFVASLTKLEGICDDIMISVGVLTLGRKAGNGLVLADPYLSGRQADIVADEAGVFLVDVGSTNGTFVNGQKLVPQDRQLLLDGDEVQLGQTKYRFETLAAPLPAVELSDVGTNAGTDEHLPALDENIESIEE